MKSVVDIQHKEFLSIIKTMEYGDNNETARLAQEWIKSREPLSPFINGEFLQVENPSKVIQVYNPCAKNEATATLCIADISSTCQNMGASPNLSSFSIHEILISIQRQLNHNHPTLEILESLQSGKPIRHVRDREYPILLETIKYLLSIPLPHDNLDPMNPQDSRQPLGLVLLIVDSGHSLSVLPKALEIIAAGNSILMAVHPQSSLTSLFFAQLCHNARLPNGSFNVIPLDHKENGTLIVDELAHLPNLAKVVCFSQDFALIRNLQSSFLVPFEVATSVKSTAIIFENADISSAVEGIVEQFISSSASYESAPGLKILVQESVQSEFIELLKRRWSNLRQGTSLDNNADLPLIQRTFHPTTLDEPDAKVFYINAEVPPPENSPLLITNLSTSSRLVHDPLVHFFGIIVLPFRTVKEGVELAKNASPLIYGPISLWSEGISLIMEVVQLLPHSLIWANGENHYKPSLFGSPIRSNLWASAAWGGIEGFQREQKPSWINENSTPALDPTQNPIKVFTALPNDLTMLASYKFFYKNTSIAASDQTVVCLPTTPLTQDLPLAYIPVATDKDIVDCLSSARAAQVSWHKLGMKGRGQHLSELARAVQNNSLVEKLSRYGKIAEAQEAVMKTAERIRWWAKWCYHFSDGSISCVSPNKTVLLYPEPLGVVVVFCPDFFPFRRLCSIMGPLLAAGNVAVLVPSFANPYPALQLYEAFSHLPSGVVSVLTGNISKLAALPKWPQVDAVWYHSTFWNELLDFRHEKQAWFLQDTNLDWNSHHEAFELEVYHHVFYNKLVWLGSGTIFAN